MQDEDLREYRRDDQGDELRIEDLDESRERRTLLSMTRRLWRAWQTGPSGRRGRVSLRLVAAGLTAVIALTLVGLAGDRQPQVGGEVSRGSDPVPVTASDAAPTMTVTGKAPARVGTSDWEQIALPNLPGTSVRSMTPSPSDPSTIFACTGAAIPQPLGDAPSGPLVIWRTHDAGQHWSSLPLPALHGTWCELQLAADGSSRVTLVAQSPLHYDVYISDNEGNSWMQVMVPTVVPTPENDVTIRVWATAHHLYYWYEYVSSVRYLTTVTSSGSSTTIDRAYATVFGRSDDDGRTWEHADGGLPSSPLDGIFAYQTHDENHLLTRFIRPMGQAVRAKLWETLDAGRSWHEAMTIGEFAGLLVVPAGGNAAVTGDLPDFATLDEQLPSDLYRLKVLARQADGPWQLLPPLPLASAQPDRTGLLQVYQETNDGRLLTFGVDLGVGVPAEGDQSAWNGTQSQWLWIWDPRVGRWLPWPSPLPFAYGWTGGNCLWHATTWISSGSTPGTYLWVRDFYGRLGKPNVAYRVFVPDAPPGQLAAQG